jgi:hypothetical protein
MVSDPNGTANATGLLPVSRLALITLDSANRSHVRTELPCTRCDAPDIAFLAIGAFVDGTLDLVAGDGRHVVTGLSGDWSTDAALIVYRCRACGQVFGVAQRDTPEGIALTSVNLDSEIAVGLQGLGGAKQ